MDDFAIACDDQTTATSTWNDLDTHLKAALKRETGLIRRHNGIDIEQSEDGIKVYCRTYLEKILSTKSFNMTITQHKPIPMANDNNKMTALELTIGSDEKETQKLLHEQFGFKYRNTTGELIFALVMCRPNISFPVMKLSQYNTLPAEYHYEAIQEVYRYLNATIDDGLMFWRPKPCRTLTPSTTYTPPQPDSYKLFIPPENKSPNTAYFYADSDFAGDRQSQRSVGGIIIMFGGAAIVYKTILQRTIALSSTEAEFYALTEAGKLVLYIRFVLADLGLEQTQATIIYEDNKGCLQMTQALKPTKRTRHVETRYFKILEWAQTEQLKIDKINTVDNASDTLTKATGRILFYRHNDTILGRRKPLYVQT